MIKHFTMTCNSDQSGASSSESGEDSELEQHEYERRRELYLSKIIFCERKYHEIKPAILKLRLDQIEKLQDSILNRKSDIYLTRKAVLDKVFESKQTHIKVLRQLRLEALQRRLAGDRWDASVNLKNNKALAKDAIRESIRQKYEKLMLEQREVEKMIGLSFDKCANGENDKRLISVKAVEKYSNTKDSEGEPLWFDIPVLIAQLPKHKIAEDLNILFQSTENIANK